MAGGLRSTWTGSIQVSLLTFPVKLYKATNTPERFPFNQLHAGCGGRIGIGKYCKSCNADVADDAIEKGFEYAKDRYVVVNQEEIDSVKLDTDNTIEVVAFVNRDEIPGTFFDEKYFIGTDGPVSDRPFALLRAAMEKTGKVAVGRVVIRGREDYVMIEPSGERGMSLQKLHYRHEVRSDAEVPVPNISQVDDKSMKLAAQLVSQFEASFAEIDMADRYSDAMKIMLHQKQLGNTIEVKQAQVNAPSVDILAALEASVQKKSAEKKTAKAGADKSLKLVKEKKKKAA